MGDEPRIGRPSRAAFALGAGALMIASLAGRDAAAQTGYLQGRYERLVGEAVVQRPDGSVTDSTFTQSYWLQNYQLDHRLTLRKFDLSWQLGFQDRQAVERLDRVQTPYGNFRLAAPIAGLYAAVKPVTSTTLASALVPGGAGANDSLDAQRVRFRTTETTVTGYVTPARLPRLDVSWIRLQRGSGGGSAGAVSDRRNARLSQQTGPVSLRANYGDVGQGNEGASVRVYQRNFGAGAGVALEPRPGMGLTADYDFSNFERGNPGNLDLASRSHRAAVNGSWRQSRALSWSLSSWYQRSESPLPRGTRVFENAEGQLYGVFQPRRAFRVQSGTQVRRVSDASRSSLEGVVLASAALEGPIREGWRGLAEISQTLTSNPFRPSYGVTSLRGSSQGRLRPGIDLALALQLASNSDTIPGARAASQGTASLQLTPLRTIQTGLRASFYRIGSSFAETENESRTGQVDLRWAPLQNVEIFGSLSRHESVTLEGSGSVAQTAYVRWIPQPSLQLDANYSATRRDDTPGPAGALASRDREIVSGHATWNLDPTKQISAQVSLLDPDTRREVTSYDATFTWRFWR